MHPSQYLLCACLLGIHTCSNIYHRHRYPECCSLYKKSCCQQMKVQRTCMCTAPVRSTRVNRCDICVDLVFINTQNPNGFTETTGYKWQSRAIARTTGARGRGGKEFASIRSMREGHTLPPSDTCMSFGEVPVCSWKSLIPIPGGHSTFCLYYMNDIPDYDGILQNSSENVREAWGYEGYTVKLTCQNLPIQKF